MRTSRRVDDILETTMELVGSQGLQAVTHRAVAQAAGVSLGAISHHFPSRDALLEATLAHAGEREVRRLNRLALELQSRLFDTDEWIDRESRHLGSEHIFLARVGEGERHRARCPSRVG